MKNKIDFEKFANDLNEMINKLDDTHDEKYKRVIDALISIRIFFEDAVLKD